MDEELCTRTNGSERAHAIHDGHVRTARGRSFHRLRCWRQKCRFGIENHNAWCTMSIQEVSGGMDCNPCLGLVLPKNAGAVIFCLR